MSFYNGKKVLSVVAVEHLAPRGNIKLTENGSYDVRAYQKAVVSVFPSGTIQTIEDEGVAQGAGAFPSTILPKGLVNYVGGASKVSHNLWDEEWETGFYDTETGAKTQSQGVIRCKNLIKVSPTATYYFKGGARYSIGIKITCFDLNGDYLGSSSVLTNIKNTTFSVPNNCHFIGFNTYSIDNITTYNNDICINLSDPSFNGQYEPHWEGFRHAIVTNLLSTDGTNETDYQIPAEVRALDGYGLGIDDTLYNYIDFERKKFVKKVASYTFTGNEVWNGISYNRCYINTSALGISIKSVIRDAPANLICNNFTTIDDNHLEQADMQISYFNGQIGICLTKATSSSEIGDASAVQTYLRDHPTTIVFELNTPTETDISEYLDTTFTDENLITLYEDGKVYFENQYNIEVPYSLTYQERII